MICLVKPSWPVSPELGSTELLESFRRRSPAIARQQQQQQHLRFVHSSVEFPEFSSPNHLCDFVLPVPNQLLCYGPALTFRSRRKIIDLLPAQDTTMSVDQKFYSLSNSGGRTYLPSPQFKSISPTSGQNFGLPPGELFGVQRNGGRAGRVWVSISSEASRENSEKRRKTESESYGGIWDSNAENVPRRRFTKTDYNSRPELESPSSFAAKGRSSRTQFQEEREWDYESPDADDEPRASQSWQRWFPNFFNGIDNEDEDDEDYDDDDQGLPSWLTVDLPAALTILRWGLPALLLLGIAAIPSVLGNPLTLLLGFSFFASLAKALNPLAKQLLGVVTSPFRGSSSTRRKRRNKSPSSTTTYRQQGPVTYTDNGSNTKIVRRSYDSNSPKQASSLGPSGFGGWDDLAEDRAKSPSLWPLQKRKKTSKKLARREQPLFIKIILALFPFLRGWGGLL